MNEILLTDEEMQSLIKGGKYFKEYRKMHLKNKPISYYNWCIKVQNEIIRSVHGEKRALDAFKGMLQSICDKNERNKSGSGLFSYGVAMASIFIPIVMYMMECYDNFSSNMVHIIYNVVGNGSDSLQMLNESFNVSVTEAWLLLCFSLPMLFVLHYLQRFLDYNTMMHKCYHQELLRIANIIDLSDL